MAEMSEAAKAAQREYLRKWSKANRDKRREYNRKYWERKAAQLLAQQEETQQENDPQ